jgi:apolipoprotein D and lipocalin family protein
MKSIWLVSVLLLLTACTGTPEGVVPVSGFDQARYLGEWHEVARLDHRFERGLTRITATYTLREDGDIRVLNRGWDVEEARWQEAEGHAKFVGESDVAHLQVSFFGPFFGSYVVFELGENYDYAFVSGYNTDYLWLLARTPTVSDAIRERFVARADALGFAVDELIWPGDTPGD